MRITTWHGGLVLGIFTLASLGPLGCSGTEAGKAQQPAPTVAGEANTPGAQAGAAPRGDHMARFLQRFDKNGDGKIQVSELPPRMQEHMAEADLDHDGVLSPDEMKAHAEAKRAEHFKKQDTNGDGALDANEVGAEHWAHIQVADADGDGKVTQAELDQAHASGKLHFDHAWRGEGPEGREHAMKRDPSAMFQRLDKNGDGVLKADEVDPRFWSHLVKADANGDGAVSKDELEQARARFHEERETK